MASNVEWNKWLEKYEAEDKGALIKFEEDEKTPQKPEVIVKTVADELQILANILLDDATGVTWDLYRLNQRDKLDLKIRMALFPESIRVKENGKEVI